MTELDRFLAGDHARHLRNIAIVIQPTMAHYADHLRAIAAELRRLVPIPGPAHPRLARIPRLGRHRPQRRPRHTRRPRPRPSRRPQPRGSATSEAPVSNRPHGPLERIEAAMADVADSEFALRRLDRRVYALCASPVITDEAIDAAQEEIANLRANLARLRRSLQEMREAQ